MRGLQLLQLSRVCSLGPRPLLTAALSDDEYTLFTSSFADLVATDPPLKPDDDSKKITVSIPEARAWLRGRYPDLPVSDLDQVRLSRPT